jgi:RNA ligase
VRYAFPHNLTLDEVRLVIQRHNARTATQAFIEANRGDHVVFNYIVSFEQSFPPPDTQDEALNREYAILRECRGLIMCPTTGTVLARRYHKFFNVGERAETLPQHIDFSQPHVILEKLDGSMITPFHRADGSLAWGTKMGATDVAQPVQEHVDANPKYVRMAQDLIAQGMTPIYEWCSRQQRIIIDYLEDQLVLTAIRDNATGRYQAYEHLLAYGAQYGIPVVRALPGSVESITEFMVQVRDLTGAEGYVIRFADGHMLKVKGVWYLQLHKTKELLQWEKDVWGLILHGKLDDAKAFMDGPDRDRVEAFAQAFATAVAKTADRLHWIVIAARDNIGESKKRFAIEIVNVPSVPVQERGLLFKIWEGGDPVLVVREYLTAHISTQTKVNEVRPLIGGLHWHDFRGERVDLDA